LGQIYFRTPELTQDRTFKPNTTNYERELRKTTKLSTYKNGNNRVNVPSTQTFNVTDASETYRILVGIPERKIPLGRPVRRCKADLKLVLKKTL
jgi:hypothetical protein